ncbi:aspartic peptidase domain-containing protein [Camillea tinctor]|nr:aspartic peptidase domain-containing protein [Camillea tinctor]
MWPDTRFFVVVVSLATDLVAGHSWTIPLATRAVTSKSNTTGNDKWQLPWSHHPHWRVHSKTSNIGLTDWVDRTDNQWYIDIFVGRPPQKFTVLWDTGSSDLVIPGINCTTCGNHTLFKEADSRSFVPLNGGEKPLEYSTGLSPIPFLEPESIGGITAFDTIGFSPELLSQSQEFLYCNKYPPCFAYGPVDSILGISPFNEDERDQTNLFWNLWELEKFDEPVFSLYLARSGSQVTLGGVDPTKFTGNISFVPLTDNPLYSDDWALEQTALYINGSLFQPSAASSSRPGPPHSPHRPYPPHGLHDSWRPHHLPHHPPSHSRSQPHTYAGAPCAEIDRVATDFTFILGDGRNSVSVTLPRSAFNLGEYPGMPGICQAVFNNKAIKDGINNFWVLGSPLLKAYYTVWNGVDRKIGWAEVKV